jgi:hypothetical protein
MARKSGKVEDFHFRLSKNKKHICSIFYSNKFLFYNDFKIYHPNQNAVQIWPIFQLQILKIFKTPSFFILFLRLERGSKLQSNWNLAMAGSRPCQSYDKYQLLLFS